MKCSLFLAAACALGALPAAAESLHYNINWSSGLSLGEATLSSSKAEKWTFDIDLNANVPGFTVRDRYHSAANAELCSTRLEKDTVHGQRKTKETLTFDQEQSQVKRETQGGGHSEFSTGVCARDALALLQFVRKELVQGRLAPQQTAIFGGEYQIRLDYSGVQHIKTGDTTTEAERIQTSITGPGSGITLELFFARDSVRTPLLARIPLSIGTLTVELAR